MTDGISEKIINDDTSDTSNRHIIICRAEKMIFYIAEKSTVLRDFISRILLRIIELTLSAKLCKCLNRTGTTFLKQLIRRNRIVLSN